MLRTLLVILILCCTGNLFYTGESLSAFDRAGEGYALVQSEEIAQFDTSGLGKTPRDIYILSRKYGQEIVDIQISMPTIADSLRSDRQDAPRNDTFKLVFTEHPDRLDDFVSGSRKLLSGRALESFSLNRGECVISSTLAEENGLSVGDELTLVHFFNWSFRFRLVIADIYSDVTAPFTGELGGYTSRRNEIIAGMDTLLSNARVVSVLQSQQVHAQYLIRRNDTPLDAGDAPFVQPLSEKYRFVQSEMRFGASLSVRVLILSTAALLCAEAIHRLYKRRRDREYDRLSALFQLQSRTSRCVRKAVGASVLLCAVAALYPVIAPQLNGMVHALNGAYTVNSAGAALPIFFEPFYSASTVNLSVHWGACLLALPWVAYLFLSERPRRCGREILLDTDRFSGSMTVVYCTKQEDVDRLMQSNNAFTLCDEIHLTVRGYLALFGVRSNDRRPMDSLSYEKRAALQLQSAAQSGRTCIVVENRAHAFDDHAALYQNTSFRFVVLTLDVMPEYDCAVYGWRDGRLLLVRLRKAPILKFPAFPLREKVRVFRTKTDRETSWAEPA